VRKKEDIEDDELEVLKPQLPTWWDYELQAIKETDPDKKDEIYQKGLKKYPNSFELHKYTFLNIVWINYWIVL
jgi:hypothetical protein